ncbi:hypothetical protein QT971_06295 [Microcoleus sp. herbarium19]|uniref:hypothetical protein n=1 Tax=Microcoleus sp. herbarium19 TaxID=3055440 RepID=UPI002FD25473
MKRVIQNNKGEPVPENLPLLPNWIYPEDHILLLMATSVYGTPQSLYGYELVESTTRYAKWMYQNKTYLAFKGTSFDTDAMIHDILDDVQIAVGDYCNLSLIQNIPITEDITFTGHSLGGTAALCMATKYPLSRAVSFNGGAPPTNPFRKGPGPNRGRHYHIEGDLISSHMTPQAAEIIRIRKPGPSWGTTYPHGTERFIETEGEMITANQEQASYVRWGGTLLKPLTCLKPIPGSTIGCFV